MLRVKRAIFKRNLTLTTIVFNKPLSAQCVVLGAIVVKQVVCVVDNNNPCCC